jgi:hypothetical protein
LAARRRTVLRTGEAAPAVLRKEHFLMPEKRVTVWVQHFADRPYLMLQWHDPVTGKRKSRSAETCNPLEAEKKRADLEYELNHGLYSEPSQMAWETFRELFLDQYAAGLRPETRKVYENVFNLFDKVCRATAGA